MPAAGNKGRGRAATMDRFNLESKIHAAHNWITTSKRFRDMCRDTFKQMDMDNSGELDKTEVYCGVLLLYTQIIAYVYTATPPPKEVVEEMVRDLDEDGNETLNEEEFHQLAVLLCKHITARVSTQAFFAFVVGPTVASVIMGVATPLMPDAPDILPDWFTDVAGPAFKASLLSLTLALCVPPLLAMIDRHQDIPNKVPVVAPTPGSKYKPLELTPGSKLVSSRPSVWINSNEVAKLRASSDMSDTRGPQPTKLHYS